tara:strand:- start:8488 stop:9270 length:783 start_codon:yes stop_codon:yes gene_type:complete
MITCKLQGGVGNQMFQIATTYSYAKSVGTSYGFDRHHCHTPNQGNVFNKYVDNFFKKVNIVPNINDVEITGRWVEPSFSYFEIPKSNNNYLEGYFQSEKYFKTHKNDIKDLFSFSDETIKRVSGFLGKLKKPITAVHVRRGDYLKFNDHHISCTVDYYKEAIKKIGGGLFVFISDDIGWCSENFKGENIHYSPFTYEIDDLYLISKCDNQIIANSSFSWWGAYLCDNNNNNNKVIAPKKWFGVKGPQDTQDIYPENWIKL